MNQALVTGRLFDGEQWLEQHAVLIEDDTISAVVPADAIPAGWPVRELPQGFLAPGFIDLQVNGGGGILLTNEPTPASVARMLRGHRASGTTAMLPTVISATPEVHRAAVAAVQSARAAGQRGVLGIHLEGPFFEPARRGTHQAAMIRKPGVADIDWLAGLGRELTTLVTLAPEHLPPGVIERLSGAGVLVCAGHTGAGYDQIQGAIAEGLRGFTHLFNAMSPLTAREPGTVGAALDAGDCWVGLIADGHHVHPASIRIASRALPRGKLCLVTDAMATVGADQDDFELYGARIQVTGGKLVNAEGALAGSAIGMIDAVCYCHREVGLPLEEALQMASRYPAAFLRLQDRLGRIAAGYRADLVHIDPAFDEAGDNSTCTGLRVLETWVAGAGEAHARPTD